MTKIASERRVLRTAVWVLIKREWLKLFKEPARAFGIFAQPLLFWLVIGSGFVPSFRLEDNSALSYQTYFFPGILALFLLFSAIFSMITLIDDKASGFMQAVLISPNKRSSIVLGKILGAFSIAVLQLFLFFPFFPLANISFADVQWFYFLTFIVLGALSFNSLGFVLAWISPSSATFHALMSVLLIPLWILSGAMFPTENTWMSFISHVNPASWLVSGFQFSLLSNQLDIDSAQVFANVFPAALKLIIFIILSMSAGVYLCHRNR